MNETLTHRDMSVRLARDRRRVILYALPRARRNVDRYVIRALSALRDSGAEVVVVVTGSLDSAARAELQRYCSTLADAGDVPFARRMYKWALQESGLHPEDVDEIVLTGSGWFGPTHRGLIDVFAAMDDSDADLWELIEQRAQLLQEFPAEGFPHVEEPYLWVRVRGALTNSDFLYGGSTGVPLARRASSQGFSTAAMFTAESMGSEDPALMSVEHLIEAGCPVLPRGPFAAYPPFLQRHAVIGRELMSMAVRRGFDLDEVLEGLTRTIAPKALNANIGMLEVLLPSSPESVPSLRILALAHITDLNAAEDLLQRLESLPEGYDLVVTTTDGAKAALLGRLMNTDGGKMRHAEVRVTPASPGRDMSDLFIACRDLLLGGNYDLLVKVHARPMGRKTRVVRQYFRRYQLDNMLASQEYVAQILNLFMKEKGLGLVFPPMIHIGYHTMGKGWSHYRRMANLLAARMGIQVPADEVSPLAPFGGMFFARPAALQLLANERWTYGDYRRSGGKRSVSLARVQERLLVPAAAELGFHSRNVLTAEHFEISHTALEYKVDELSSTVSGYPVEQIALLHRAGRIGRGGPVSLVRMFLRAKHPRIAHIFLPMMSLVERVYLGVRTLSSESRDVGSRLRARRRNR